MTFRLMNGARMTFLENEAHQLPQNRRSSQRGCMNRSDTTQTAGASEREAHSGHASHSQTSHTTMSAAKQLRLWEWSHLL